MKKYIFPLLTICFLLLTACSSGISSKEYESIVSENASLKSEIESLKSQNQSLKKSFNEQIKEDWEEIPITASTVAWITTSFGDDSIYLVDDDNQYLQCIAGKTYSIATEDIYTLIDDLQLSLSLLEDIKSSIKYQQISIKFVDSSGIYILEVTLNLSEDSYILNSIMCDVVYADVIIPALQDIAN